MIFWASVYNAAQENMLVWAYLANSLVCKQRLYNVTYIVSSDYVNYHRHV